MNTDSKLKRFIVLLDKSPFIAFFESPNCINKIPPLRTLDIVDGESSIRSVIEIKENTDLRVVISDTNKLPDPLAYNIIEALAAEIGYAMGSALPVEPCFKSAKWQEHIKWLNVDNKPEPTKDIVIVVCKLTHDLRIFNGEKTVNLDCDGEIVLHCLDTKVPFPQALLKECTMEVYNIIMTNSIGRAPIYLSKSFYLSVMNTGHEAFHYISLRQIEKDLKALLTAFDITIEE